MNGSVQQGRSIVHRTLLYALESSIKYVTLSRQAIPIIWYTMDMFEWDTVRIWLCMMKKESLAFISIGVRVFVCLFRCVVWLSSFLDTFHSFLFRFFSFFWWNQNGWSFMVHGMASTRSHILAYIYFVCHVETLHYNDNRFGMGICLFVCRVIEPTQKPRTQRTMLLMARKIKKKKNVRGSVPNRMSPVVHRPPPVCRHLLPSLDPLHLLATDQQNKKKRKKQQPNGRHTETKKAH